MLSIRRRVALAELPQRAIDDRTPTLRRVLADLPDPLLAALISGLELHGDHLRCGRLYSSYDSSCAAGAMMRQLHPDRFEVGRFRFLLRHRWRRHIASYGGMLQTGMHASLLEAIFDRVVWITRLCEQRASIADASRLAGRWLLAEAERELGIREYRRAAGLPPIVSWREQALRRWGEGMERRLPHPAPAGATA
jgi:hypothetical protein